MLLVKTSVKQSSIHGLGVFADEDIAPGRTIWRLKRGFDRVIPVRTLTRFPSETVAFLEFYSEYFPELGVLVLSGDNDRYTNHSDDPNTDVMLPNRPQALVVASRAIRTGEEITCDYGVIRTRHFAPQRLPDPASAP